MLALALGVFKVVTTASSPSAWLVALLRSFRLVRGVLRPSLWIRVVLVVPFWNTEMMSLFVTSGSSVQCLEKRRM
jgi:hypothetical protein